MKRTVQRKAWFETVDADGKVEVLYVDVEFLEIRSIEGRSSVEIGQFIVTTEGQSVDKVDRGVYRVRLTGRLLHCGADQTNAP